MGKWADVSPREAGYYWYRDKDKQCVVVEVYKHPAWAQLRVRFLKRDSLVATWYGEWWPIRIKGPEE